jgi:hypothetical protein
MKLMLVDVLFQYRTLIGKCELGSGLDWEDIETVSAIEAMFDPSPEDRRLRRGRRFRRQAVRLQAVVRGDRIHDRVEVTEISLDGMVIRNAPYIARGEQTEIVIDDGELSYRFRVRGVWLKEDGDDYRVGLQIIGMPVCLHKVAVSAHQYDVVDKIAAAA